MHTILAVAAAHERYHDMTQIRFGQRPRFLGLLAIASFDATDPRDAWPLAAPSSEDLEWFTLSEGKKAVWKLTNPLRPGGLFSPMAHEYAAINLTLPRSGAEDMEPWLASLCNINESSTADNNPYFAAAHNLTQLQNNAAKGMERICFVSQSRDQFLELLRAKDRVALVLLGMWYESVERECWWVERRAKVEGSGIRAFLSGCYHDGGELLDLLDSADGRAEGKERLQMVE
ncbi:hypothetical protein N0V90_003651 [Kalmusia sp. IMI 367209]|nr:hypothetical protein N0V90_003651 [Kalmusia sp. IMI 367209]